MFLGYSRVLVLAYSLALSHLAVGAWLVVKGFAEARRTLPADERHRGGTHGPDWLGPNPLVPTGKAR
jgi:hypothetical protein